MKKSGFIVALYLLLTFSSGVAIGGFGFWLYTSRSVSAGSGRLSPEEYRKRYVQEMETRLKLTPDQLQKLSLILDSTRALFKEVAEKHRPEFDAIQQHQTRQIRAILNPDQQAEYEKLRAEREARKKKNHKPH
jgi:hypothetical protein